MYLKTYETIPFEVKIVWRGKDYLLMKGSHFCKLPAPEYEELRQNLEELISFQEVSRQLIENERMKLKMEAREQFSYVISVAIGVCQKKYSN